MTNDEGSPKSKMNLTANLDPAALARLCRLGGNKFAREMIDLFLDYVGKKVAEARQAQLAGDLAGVEKAVHPVKSSAGNVGAVRVHALATRLEREAKAGQAAAIAAGFGELEQAFAAVGLELAAARQTLVDDITPPLPP